VGEHPRAADDVGRAQPVPGGALERRQQLVAAAVRDEALRLVHELPPVAVQVRRGQDDAAHALVLPLGRVEDRLRGALAVPDDRDAVDCERRAGVDPGCDVEGRLLE
jgi:hypothetical protein